MAAAKPILAMNHDRLKISLETQSASSRRDLPAPGTAPQPGQRSPFSDGEIHLQLQENVRGADVFIIQPTCTPVERNLMELLR